MQCHGSAAQEKPSNYATLAPLICGVITRKQINGHCDEILHLATSIKHGSVTASLILPNVAHTHARTA